MKTRLFIFKPDAIGDFLLASGAIRKLADKVGEEHMTLALRDQVAPLAAREFPASRIISLSFQPRVKGRNVTAANMVKCFPAWLQLCRLQTDLSVCFRSIRSFLDTLIFVTPRAARRVAPANVRLRRNRLRHRVVEHGFFGSFRPQIVPYSESPTGLPSDLESHRRVLARVLEREVTASEIMPLWQSDQWESGDFWLLCPCSSQVRKDYLPEQWAQALGAVADLVPAGGIRLAGGPDQVMALEELAALLRPAIFPRPVRVDRPVPLADFPRVMARSALVLTVDTATAHLACALRAPAVILACGINPGVYLPYSPDGRQHWLIGDGKMAWSASLLPSTVATAIRRVLA